MSQQESTQRLLEGLNPEQEEAVSFGPGPLLIIAGAGTGKTKVITHRIAHLVATKKAAPEEILAVTFTEKAASEMEERVDILVPYGYSFVEISTFNSFGERVLRSYAHELGFPLDFRLLDDVEQAIFFRERLFRFSLSYYRPAGSPTRHILELLDAIRRLKQEDISPEEYQHFACQAAEKAEGKAESELAQKHVEVAHVYGEYQSMLKAEGKIDFEDQVALVVELFRKRPSVLAEFQRKYKYILVDEFQDTNHIQYELLKLMSGVHRNLTVVGDDDQSIFRFRGASLSNIMHFKRDFPDARKVVLTRNFRSTQAILDVSYRLIQQNNPDRLEYREKIDKKLVADSPEAGKEKSIHFLQLDTVSHEADRTAAIIRGKVQKEGMSYKDFAILVRRNADADPFLRALNMNQIPFRFSGSRGLYSQPEVKILVAFLKALTDFDDSRNLFFLALSEVYGVHPYDLTLLSNFAAKRHLTLHGVFRLVHEDKSPVPLSEEGAAVVKRVFSDLLAFVELAAARNAGQILYAFLEKSGFLKTLVSAGNLKAEARIKNIRIFFDKVKGFSAVAKDDSVHAFVRHLDLLQEMGDNPSTAEADLDEEAVNILTVHKAKGLEFPAVFMASLIADRFPGRERREKIPFPDPLLKEPLPAGESMIQEERRLFYVGMTRAKRLLYFTWARDYGLKRQKKVSPFVLEALDLRLHPQEIHKASAAEEIKRSALPTLQPDVLTSPKEGEVLPLSYFQVEDYITCPLKYRYRHVLRIPVLPHHSLVFGRVIHNVVHHFLRRKMAGDKVSEAELLHEYESLWVNEGYLSREHEEARKQAGARALSLFYRREGASRGRPVFLEREFRWQEENIRFTGRWDRVDINEEGAVITDYKASEVKDQKEADRRASGSLQLDLYSLSFEKTQEVPLLEVRLHFLESDVIGRAQKGEKEKGRAWEKIQEASDGLRRQAFEAKPDWHNCNYCDFKTICPSTYAY